MNFKFLHSTPARIVTVVLVLQGGLLYSSIRPEIIPTSPPLSDVARTLGPWSVVAEGVIEPEIQAVLQADDTLNRTYQRAGSRPVNLFVASFRSQRAGKAPHSPKNCLPGSGWIQQSDSVTKVDAGLAEPIEINRYIISSGETRALVLYWYQSRDRVVADEFKAKIWVMADAIRYNRTDTSLVRVVIEFDPKKGFSEEQADKLGAEFIRDFYAPVRRNLPS